MKRVLSFLFLLVLSSCSPLKTSLHDDKYQWELTLHEVQTNVDDLRHDTNYFSTEMQILDGRLKSVENALALVKKPEVEKQSGKLDQMAQSLALLEKKWRDFEKRGEGIDQLTQNAKETHLALSQFKTRIEELEAEIAAQQRKLEAVVRLKGALESLTSSMKPKVYKVRSGDSLEKIAKLHGTDVAMLKKLNQLSGDRIVIDQELSIP